MARVLLGVGTMRRPARSRSAHNDDHEHGEFLGVVTIALIGSLFTLLRCAW